MDAPVAKKILRFLGKDFYMEVAKGQVSGHDGFHVFGINTNVSATEDTVWTESGKYTYPPDTAKNMVVVSPNQANASGGTGARAVKILGLDSNFSVISEVVSTQGSTVVSTANAYARILRFGCIGAGSAEENVGTIYVGASTVAGGVPSEVYAAIASGAGVSQMAVFTVPRNKVAFIVDSHIACRENDVVTGRYRTRLLGADGSRVWQDKLGFYLRQGTEDANLKQVRGPFSAKTDIEVRALSSSGGPGTAVEVSAGIIVIDSALVSTGANEL